MLNPDEFDAMLPGGLTEARLQALEQLRDMRDAAEAAATAAATERMSVAEQSQVCIGKEGKYVMV